MNYIFTRLFPKTMKITHSIINFKPYLLTNNSDKNQFEAFHNICHFNAKDVMTKHLHNENNKLVPYEDIINFLEKSNLKFQIGYTCCRLKCHRHQKSRNKQNFLYINLTTGFFMCFECLKCGPWSSFILNTNQHLEHDKNKKKLSLCFEDIKHEEIYSDDLKEVHRIYNESIEIQTVDLNILNILFNDFNCQKINIKTFQKFKVKILKDNAGFVFPIFSSEEKLANLKIVYISSQQQISRLLIRDACALFGYNLLENNRQNLVIASNEFDAMLINQETGYLSICLPNGERTLSSKVLPMLENFNKIILWLNSSPTSWQNSKTFAMKLNSERCFIIRPDASIPSPIIALNKSISLQRIIESAKAIHHKSITTFKQLRSQLHKELLNHDLVSGVKWLKYPILNQLLKGHRRGELTVFTGPTGSGKTTFISDYSLDLSMQGVNTLWGSFEINNIRLVKTMLNQFANMNLVKNVDKFESYANDFEQLPIYFMTFHGQENIKQVIDTMTHAVYVHDIAHVVVDNLQFMLGIDNYSSNANERFMRQDMVVASFRKFATKMNCHVTIVIHPRKEKESEDLSVSSIFGSAKVSQEADNILILQDKRLVTPRGRKYIQIAKNRFDGELGVMLIKFDKESSSFAPPLVAPIKNINNQNKIILFSDCDKYRNTDYKNELYNDAT